MRCSRRQGPESFARRFRCQRPMGSLNGSSEPRTECLDWLLILNTRHLERTLALFIDHYNGHRPHRSLDLAPPRRRPTTEKWTSSQTLPISRRDVSAGCCMSMSAWPDGIEFRHSTRWGVVLTSTVGGIFSKQIRQILVKTRKIPPCAVLRSGPPKRVDLDRTVFRQSPGRPSCRSSRSRPAYSSSSQPPAPCARPIIS